MHEASDCDAVLRLPARLDNGGRYLVRQMGSAASYQSDGAEYATVPFMHAVTRRTGGCACARGMSLP